MLPVHCYCCLLWLRLKLWLVLHSDVAPLLTVPLQSSQPFSWGLGLQEPGQGVHTGALGAHFEIPSKPL
jgi:hypothetical protein